MDDVRGKLGAQFRAATLAFLHAEFIAAAPDTDKSNAARVLSEFYLVASRLCSREREFNKRARPANATPSLMANLRGPAHFATLREFSAAKEAVLEVNLKLGRGIVRLAERDIDDAAQRRPAGPVSAPALSL